MSHRMVRRLGVAAGLILSVGPSVFGAEGIPISTPTGTGTTTTCTPDPRWQVYGFQVPGSPVYGFGAPDPFRQDFLNLNAKGNIVVGDYTLPEFRDYVLDRVDPTFVPQNPLDDDPAVTLPRVVDPTDVPLGYDTDPSGGLPRFDGNYNQPDLDPRTGARVAWPDDGNSETPVEYRKFYESSLPPAEFARYVDPVFRGGTPGVTLNLDGVLFTNHGILGYAPVVNTWIDGALVARDDALIYGRNLIVSHDERLMGSLPCGRTTRPRFFLPVTLERSAMVRWHEVPVQTPTPNGTP